MRLNVSPALLTLGVMLALIGFEFVTSVNPDRILLAVLLYELILSKGTDRPRH